MAAAQGTARQSARRSKPKHAGCVAADTACHGREGAAQAAATKGASVTQRDEPSTRRCHPVRFRFGWLGFGLPHGSCENEWSGMWCAGTILNALYYAEYKASVNTMYFAFPF